MSLSRGRKRVSINGALLSRAQTITFENKLAKGDCFTASDGVMRCTNDNRGTFTNRSKFIDATKIKATNASIAQAEQELQEDTGNDRATNVKKGPVDFIKEMPENLGKARKNFTKTTLDIIREVKDDPMKAAFKLKDKSIEWIITNENKFRAAKVLADAVSLGLIVVGTIVLSTTAATGIGAGIGAGLIGTGTAIGAVSDKAGKGLDAVVKTAKAIQQLEDAVEVARQALATPVDRQKLIEENKPAIDARFEELLEQTKTSLQGRAAELEMKGVSLLTKSKLSRAIAEEEIIGNAGKEEVEPRIGKSLIAKGVAYAEEVVAKKQDSNKDITDVMNTLDVDEDEARRLLKIAKLKRDILEKEEEEKTAKDLENERIELLRQELVSILNDEEEDTESRIRPLVGSGLDSGVMMTQDEMDELDEEERLEREEEKASEETTPDKSKPPRPSNLDTSPLSPTVSVKKVTKFPFQEPTGPIISTIGLDDSESETPRIQVRERTPLARDPLESPIDFLKRQQLDLENELPDTPSEFLSSPFFSDLQSPSDFLEEKEEKEFEFSTIDNKDLFNSTNKNATRRPLIAAFKDGIIDRPSNFTNDKKLTATQTEGAVGTGAKAKQLAAVVNNNSQNVYDRIVQGLTESDDCRVYLTNNAATIKILPSNLQEELRNYCESIMTDDV